MRKAFFAIIAVSGCGTNLNQVTRYDLLLEACPLLTESELGAAISATEFAEQDGLRASEVFAAYSEGCDQTLYPGDCIVCFTNVVDYVYDD
jgi:hypothetical protein